MYIGEFDHRHFVERNHTLTPFGLEELVEIISQPTLCKLLKVITFNLTISPHSAAPEVDSQNASLGEPEKRDRTRVLEEQQKLQKHKQKYCDLRHSHHKLQQAHSDVKRAH